MKNFFIIILGPNVDSSMLKGKIRELGDSYSIYDNQFIVYVDCEDAKQLYERLVPNEPIGIVIFRADIKSVNSYWGYSDAGLWKWLKNIEEVDQHRDEVHVKVGELVSK